MPQLHTSSLNLYTLFNSVLRKLNNIDKSYWSTIEIYFLLNEAQLFIARKTKCLKKNVTITTTASTQEYDLKDNSFSDIIDIDENGVYFKINGTSYMPLTYKTKKQLNMESPGWQGVSASTPSYYYYDKSSKTIGLYPKPNSTNAGAYLFVEGYYKPKILHAGKAAAGSTTSLTLAAGSASIPYPSVTNDYYNNLYVEIYDGTGAGQKVEITDYVGSTRVCTISITTAPDSTSIYGMVPEIPEEMHYLMEIYTLAKVLEKNENKIGLADRYWQQFFSGLNTAITETIEEDDEEIIRMSYR